MKKLLFNFSLFSVFVSILCYGTLNLQAQQLTDAESSHILQQQLNTLSHEDKQAYSARVAQNELMLINQSIRDIGDKLINMPDEDLKTFIEIKQLNDDERAERLNNNNELAKRYRVFYRRYQNLLTLRDIFHSTPIPSISFKSVPVHDLTYEFWHLWEEIDTTLQVKAKEVSNNSEQEKAHLEESKMEAKRTSLESLREGICQYLTLPKLIGVSASSCEKNLCISEVECEIPIEGAEDHEANGIVKRFDIACQALSNGSCPLALDCATDGSVTTYDTREDTVYFQRKKTAVKRARSSQGEGVQ